MNKKPQEPKQNWGFYAVTPRIVRTQYKDLSHTEKWLYTCLKDLCGDKGTCFRSLRSLSEETDISIASLSKMVPNLHKVGLIHAEKKRRSKSGKEIWHISIIDIWQENAKGCSKNEQSEEVVQNTNNIVQNLNEPTLDCSENEQCLELGCSNFSDRRISMKNKDSEGEKESEIDIPESDSPSHSSTHSSFSTQDETQYPIVTVATRNTSSSGLSDEEQRIQGYWCQLGNIERPSAKVHWATLSKHIASFEDMDSLFKYTQAAVKDKPNKRVFPGNLVDHLDGWKQDRAPKPEKPSQPKAKITAANKHLQSFSSMSLR
jgi:predicted transcriptional regulator